MLTPAYSRIVDLGPFTYGWLDGRVTGRQRVEA